MDIIGGLKRRLTQERQIRAVLKARKRILESDPQFDLTRICLKDHFDASDDTAILERIVKAYQAAKRDEKDALATYKVGNEWLPIYRLKLGPVMDALSKGDISTLSRMYKNFYRDPCSTGLVGLQITTDKYLRLRPRRLYKLLFASDALHRFNLWRELTQGKYPVSALSAPTAGNPFGYNINGTFVSSGADYQHFYGHKIRSLIQSGTVIELGGGFGGLAYFLLRDTPQINYVDFDLPETAALASYYLLKAFPNERITLYGEMEFLAESLLQSRVWILPAFELLKMANNSTELAFNSYSLAEMSPEAIKEYVAQLTRISRKYLLHVNHNKNSVKAADDFGIEAHGFRLADRQPARWNDGRMLDADEYEYLYTKELDPTYCTAAT